MAATLEHDLPRANVRKAEMPFPSDQYALIPNVPVFAEHQTKSRSGRLLSFGPKELQQLADRCNRRIQETGDYAVIAIGHTSDPGDPVPKEPEVVGYAGPYRLGILGEPGERQRYAILADFHIRHDKIGEYNSHPRRSPELWLEDSYDEMFLDPISLLGAEAPRLDMGLAPPVPTPSEDNEGAVLYSALKSGRLREKYAAAGPSCTNVFVPAEEGAKKYAADSPPVTEPRKPKMLAPDEIRQIVDAIESLDWVVEIKQDLAARRQQENQTDLAEEVPPEAADAVPPAIPPTAEPPAVPPAAPSEPPKEPEKKYSAESGDKVPGKDKSGVPSLDDLSEEEIEKYLNGRRKARYSAEGSAGGDHPTNQPAESTVDPEHKTPAEGSVSGGSQTPEKAKYSQLQARLETLEADRIVRIDEARKARLGQLRFHRAFDLAKHVDLCRYAKMDDAAFARHVATIAEVAIPTMSGHAMPVPDDLLDATQPPPQVRQRPERYTKEKTDEAVAYVTAQAEAGRTVSYETVLENIVNGRPPE